MEQGRLNMKVIFFGTPEYVLPILDTMNNHLKKSFTKIFAVVTQPPKPIGRKKIITPSPVEIWAKSHNVHVVYDATKLIKDKYDLGILAAYGSILKTNVINSFKYGIINIHPSRLPEFRGASPIQATILTRKTPAVSFMKMDGKMDHGPIISTVQGVSLHGETADLLTKHLFELASKSLPGVIDNYVSGEIIPKKQNHKKATHTTLLKKKHGFIPWKYIKLCLQGLPFKGQWKIPFIKNYTTQYSPQTIHNFIRAMNPWPGVWTLVKIKTQKSKLKTKRLKILSAHLKPAKNGSQKTNYKLVLDTVQLEGKNPMSWKQFSKTHQIKLSFQGINTDSPRGEIVPIPKDTYHKTSFSKLE